MANIKKDDYTLFEKYEWCRTWWENANDTELPRVLLIGDSISAGYHPFVKEQLAGCANVDLFASSRAINAKVFACEIAHMLRQYPYQVIHFNNGLHGKHVTADDYRKSLAETINTIRSIQPEAKLVLVTSTPVTRKGEPAVIDADKDVVIQSRNRAVFDLAESFQLVVNDLYALMAGKSDVRSNDGYHYLPEGQRMQAIQVSNAVRALLDTGLSAKHRG